MVRYTSRLRALLAQLCSLQVKMAAYRSFMIFFRSLLWLMVRGDRQSKTHFPMQPQKRSFLTNSFFSIFL